MVISPDDFLVNEEGEYEWTPDRAMRAWDEAFKMLRGVPRSFRIVITVGIPASGKTTGLEELRQHPEWNNCVFFDAKLVSKIARRPLVEIAREKDVAIEAVVFFTDLAEALRRNMARPENRRVPYPQMINSARALEDEPPTLDEGFTRLTAVRS